jgi:citrate lyase gamma subunit
MDTRRVPRDRQAVSLVGDYSVEVQLGHGGRGVFLTIITPRGSRLATVSLGETGALRLATTLRWAGEASLAHSRDKGAT